MLFTSLGLIAFAYFCGALPFGYWAGKLNGIRDGIVEGAAPTPCTSAARRATENNNALATASSNRPAWSVHSTTPYDQ